MRDLLLVFALAAGFLPVRAQAQMPPLPRLELLFPYAHQRPRLATGDSTAAGIEAAIRSLLVYKPASQPNHVRFAFTVGKTGQVVDLLVAGNADLAHNQAAFQALRRLPRFEPGRDDNNQPVAVRLEEGVSFPQPGDLIMPVAAARAAVAPAPGVVGRRAASPAARTPNQSLIIAQRLAIPPAAGPPLSPPAFDPHKVYTYVDLMPRLRTAAGYQNISEAIQQRIVLPKGATACVGRLMANFIIGASGAVAKPRIVQGVSPACDVAVLQATRQLPLFEPGMQNGLKVAVDYTVPVLLPEKTTPKG